MHVEQDREEMISLQLQKQQISSAKLKEKKIYRIEIEILF